MSLILGIHMGHDASLTLLRDGEPVLCMSEEKLSRVKMYYGFPIRTMEFMLNKFNLSPEDFDAVALDTIDLPGLIGPEEMKTRFSRGDKSKKLIRNLIKSRTVLNYILGLNVTETKSSRELEKSKEVFFNEMDKIGFIKDKILFFDHHYCHAASAFWPSPFSEAIVYTSDGRGDGLSATISHAKNNSIKRIAKIGELDSVGQFYSAVTSYLGFSPLRHEGKITGLAAYGDKRVLGDEFYHKIKWNQDGTYSFILPEKYECRDLNQIEEFFNSLSLSFKDKIILKDQALREDLLISAKWYGQHAYLKDVTKGISKEDIASGVQYFAEKVSVEFLKKHLKKEKLPVVLAGGVFANVRINQKIRELPGVSNVFVQPAMGDDGLSLGAAMISFSKQNPRNKKILTENPRPMVIKNTFYGPKIERSEIISFLNEKNIKYEIFSNIEEKIGKWIHEGKIIGYFQGNLEYGPRALGHRSILVRPTDKKINESLNKRLNRTEFMPFAPAIIAEEAANYFIDYMDDHIASEYMTITYDVFEDKQKEIEAVVHVDGTARPQVVFKDKDPRFHKIINEYYKISGIPVIINTSFNAHEEPIVFSQEDAYRSYLNGSVDILVMEDIVIM